MASRTIIEINEDLCDGCGLCAQGCPEGALQIIDGKARMVGDSLCDGLGACIGDCPRGAIATIQREAEEYDEEKVIDNIVPKGKATIMAHLHHLYSHGQDSWYQQALKALEARKFYIPTEELPHQKAAAEKTAATAGCASGGCPGSASRTFSAMPGTASAGGGIGGISAGLAASAGGGSQRSTLEQWPVQLHLINPRAPYFRGADLLIAADCTAFACGAFHQTLLRGRKLVIACPKLDSGREIYIDKLTSLIRDSGVSSITLAIMEVPCCSGLKRMLDEAIEAAGAAGAAVPVSTVVVGIEGGTLNWL
ncbi:MAG: 4Fe-4S binding protein [Spirochaetes bacterium]|nr:4Fe-4S binding protein [Spirochaetota bacterium]